MSQWDDRLLRQTASLLIVQKLKQKKNHKVNRYQINRGTAFLTKLYVRPAKTQIHLHICAVWSEISKGVMWVAKDSIRLCADIKGLWSDNAYEMADLCFHRAHMQFWRKSCAPNYM